MASATAEFDALMRLAFGSLYPSGNGRASFRTGGRGTHYPRTVKPDFVLPNGEWVDFKLHVSYRESHRVAWRPSPLYSSVRKYLDHPSNRPGRLLVVYGTLHGSIQDVRFPIARGSKILVANAVEFQQRIQFKSALDALADLPGQEGARIRERVRQLAYGQP